jgi:hypothetical protein
MPTTDQPAMSRLAWLWVALFATLGGCLELEQTVVLAPDGSGKQTLKLALRESTLDQITRTSAAADLGAAANPKALFDKDLVGRELVAAGLSLSHHAAKQEGGKRSVELAATFGSFAILQKSPLCGSAATWELVAGPKPGTAKLTLYPQGKAAWVEARRKADAMQQELDPVATDFFQKQRAALAGLDLTLRFQLPGDVLVWTANMTQTGAREVTARVTAEQIKTPQELVRRLAPRFEVIFDTTGCRLPLP